MEIHLSPSGDDADTSNSPTWRTLERLNQWLTERPAGSHQVLFRSGAEFRGSVEYWAGDPDNPILIATDELDPAIIRPAPGSPAVICNGAGGWHLRNLMAVGDGRMPGVYSGFEFRNDEVACRNIRLERLQASGFGHAGILIMPSPPFIMRDVWLHECRCERNTNGFALGPGETEDPLLLNLEILHCEAHENDAWDAASGMAGFGIALGGVADVQIEGCRTHRNGRTSQSPGHAGLIVNYSRRVHVAQHEATGNADENPAHGDGQGIVLDNARDCLVAECKVWENRGGICVMTDSGKTDSILIRDNEITDNLCGMNVHGASTGVLFLRNRVSADQANANLYVYTAVAVTHEREKLPDGTEGEEFHLSAWFAENQVRARNGAVLLLADHCGGARFDPSTVWDSDGPIYRTARADHATLAEALTAEAVRTL